MYNQCLFIICCQAVYGKNKKTKSMSVTSFCSLCKMIICSLLDSCWTWIPLKKYMISCHYSPFKFMRLREFVGENFVHLRKGTIQTQMTHFRGKASSPSTNNNFMWMHKVSWLRRTFKRRAFFIWEEVVLDGITANLNLFGSKRRFKDVWTFQLFRWNFIAKLS